jgi:ribonuclease HI
MIEIVNIWTDGSCSGNPGPGGWGVILEYKSHKKTLFGGVEHTTNNRMELTAVIQALKAITRPCTIQIHLDSQYVRDGITSWIKGWKKKNWVTTNKTPVKNTDLWQELDALTDTHTITWVWVKGHSTDTKNEEADRLAKQGTRLYKPDFP